MAPITKASNDSNHQQLLDKLDVQGVRKAFRNPNFRTGKRNKSLRQVVADAARKQESQLATQTNSGVTTPLPDTSVAPTGTATPSGDRGSKPNLEAANENLSKVAQTGGLASTITYANIESAPSLHPSSQRHYCDITGLPAPYTDPKTRLRYVNGETYSAIKRLGQHQTESYLAARGAHTVLK